MQSDLQMSLWRDTYTAGGMDRNRLESLIFKHLFENARELHLNVWDDEEWMDYMCWLYPRIKTAIDAYKDTGSSFDAYISSLVRWTIREYRSRNADHRAMEMAYWDIKTEEFAGEDDVDYEIPRKLKKPEFLGKKQILILILKSYHFMSTDYCERIARAMDIPPEELNKLIMDMKKMRLERDQEIQNLQEQVTSQYYRCISYERRWSAAPEDSVQRDKLELRIHKARIRLESMRQRLAGCRHKASNRMVAEVLGIPKGTVDSCLHTIKWRWKTAQG